MLAERLLPVARQRLAVIPDAACVSEAAALLTKPHVDLVVVCNADREMVGVVSKSDIVSHIAECRGQACRMPVPTIMTRDVLCCHRDDWLQDVWAAMKGRGVRCIPVVDDGARPVGVLHARDALQALLSETQDEQQLLHDYVTCAGYH